MDAKCFNITRKFAYFCANFPPDFIDKCFEGEGVLISHLKEKLISRSGSKFISISDFMYFFYELDLNNQLYLIEWIDKNYTI